MSDDDSYESDEFRGFGVRQIAIATDPGNPSNENLPGPTYNNDISSLPDKRAFGQEYTNANIKKPCDEIEK